MNLIQAIDSWLLDRGRSIEDINSTSDNAKIQEMRDQWGHFSRWHVSQMGRYHDIVITISGGCLDDVSGLPEGWEYTLNDLDNEPE